MINEQKLGKLRLNLYKGIAKIKIRNQKKK